ncbi:MAG: HAMP domain-containing histidine kinase [Spirochaetes bacterium]|nr:HAMP domain-containing histidine kinase [Spirochaetota bacterium]
MFLIALEIDENLAINKFYSQGSSIDHLKQNESILKMIPKNQVGLFLDFLARLKNNRPSITQDLQIILEVSGSPQLFKIVGMATNKGYTLFIVDHPNLEQIAAILKEWQYDHYQKIVDLLKEDNQSESQYLSKYDEMTKINNELINIRRSLSKKNQELIKLNEEKNRILGVVSHDFKGLVGGIFSLTGFFLKEEHFNAIETKEIYSVIYASAQQMLDMIYNLLDYSQFETGSIFLNKKWINLNQLIHDNVKVNHFFTRDKNITIKTELKTEITDIFLDPVRINQVLNNLLQNSIKYSEANTIITIILEKHQNEVMLSVLDQGIGISQSEIDNIFKPFTKTSNTSKSNEKSYGLGLSIVKNIIELHEGRIEVTSQRGQGSRFDIYLPKVKKQK